MIPESPNSRFLFIFYDFCGCVLYRNEIGGYVYPVNDVL